MAAAKSRAVTKTTKKAVKAKPAAKARSSAKATTAAKPKTKKTVSGAKPVTAATKPAKSSAQSIAVGRAAPNFMLTSGTGEKIALKELRGKLVILYFYPKDMTPGCTTQACDFRDRIPEIEAAEAVVLGVSPDSAQSHAKFAAKHDLPFPLLADEGAQVATKYGVWQEKSLYGRKFMGNVRTTVLIDREGKVARIWPNVKVSGHADEVLESMRELAEQPV